MVFAILFEVLMMIFSLESPYWLLNKNMEENAMQVLKSLRGEGYKVEEEVAQIKAGLKQKYSIREQFFAFKQRAVYHPFALVIFLKTFQQFGGINAAIFYASCIFFDAGYSSEKTNLVSFGSVACVQVVATLVSVIMVDYLGRRTLLIASSLLMLLSSFMLGLYFLIFEVRCEKSIDSLQCPPSIEFFAIARIIIFITGFATGWGPIPVLSTSELLPFRVRVLGGSLSLFCAGIAATIIIFSFPSYAASVTPKFAWWTFSITMTVGLVVVVLFLPEAKGKSLEEIQENFERGKILVSCNC